jgi:signal transduction histidine kinase
LTAWLAAAARQDERVSRWRLAMVRGLVLRTAWLFLGAAIGLAAIILAVSLAAVLDPYVPGAGWTLYPVCLAPFLLLGLLPGVRDLEVTAARAMLGVDAELVVPRQPTAAHRWRAAVWALLHLVFGLVAAIALVGLVPGALWIAVAGARGDAVTAGSVLVPAATSALGTVARVVGGLAGVVACGLLAWGLGRLAARTAPAFLGPTAGDRLELAEARLAAEAEHTRLARDLHDGIGHALTIIAVQAAAGRRVLEQDPGTAARALAAAEEVARGALEELDGVLAALRDPGERAGPEPGVERLPTLLAAHREAGLRVVAEIAELPALPPVVSGTVYRVVAEGLANAQRYAGAGEIRLHVDGEPGAVRVVVDNPRSAGASRRSTGGRGLVGVRERVAVLGGTVEAGPQDGRWRLRATIPIGRTATGEGR